MRWPDAADVREHITDANDGILAVAGFSEGLVGAGLASTEVFGIIGISAIAGAVFEMCIRDSPHPGWLTGFPRTPR